MAQSKYKLLKFLGPECPVLLLIWLLYMCCLWPLALMEQIKLAALSCPMSLGLGITFVIFSRGRGKSWLMMSSLAFLGSCAGLAHGIWLRQTHPVTDEMLPLHYDPFILQAAFIPAGALLLFILLVSPILGKCGCKLVGSSKEFDADMAKHMVFGTSVGRNLRQTVTENEILLGEDVKAIDDKEVEEAELLAKLQDDLYYSGEPIYDYAFWLANNHLMLGCIFHHPLSPLETGHRLVVLITTCLLIVFPVALVTILWGKIFGDAHSLVLTISRLILMAAVVIGPRNFLKGKMKSIAIKDEEEFIRETEKEGESTNVKALKKRQVRKEALIYDTVAILTALFCFGTWKYVQEDSDQDTLTLLLINTDGLGFCFILEILFALVMPRKSKNPKRKCFGWFGRWHNERCWHMST